jgi:hypothetical protein
LPHEGRNDSELNIGKMASQNKMVQHMLHLTGTIIEASLPADHPLQKFSSTIPIYCMSIKLLRAIIRFLIMRSKSFRTMQMTSKFSSDEGKYISLICISVFHFLQEILWKI